LATYTICVPSGEIATTWRPSFVNCWPSASVKEKRAIVSGVDGLKSNVTELESAPTTIAADITGRARRHSG
jgi:hypothetical protein